MASEKKLRIVADPKSAESLGWICATVVLLSISSAFAGNGTAINGPDLQGVSIPSALDRGIPASRIADAAETCGRRALEPLFEIVNNGSSMMSFLMGAPVTVHENDGHQHLMRLISLYATSNQGGTEQPEQSCSVSMGPLHGSTSGLVSLKISGCLSGNGDYYSDSPVPYLEYEIGLGDVTYDEWGNVTSGKQTVENLHVMPNISTLGESIQFINSVTYQAIAFRLNPQEIAACLSSEVLKN